MQLTVEESGLINNCVGGIIQGIEVTHANKCERACLILIYAGIDSMAYLHMPDAQDEVKKKDFIRWTEKYLKFPETQQIRGIDLYGARCALVHQYGVESQLSRAGECLMIGYMDKTKSPVAQNPRFPGLIIVSITALKKAFFVGVKRFLADALSDPPKRRTLGQRLRKFLVHYDHVKPGKKATPLLIPKI